MRRLAKTRVWGGAHLKQGRRSRGHADGPQRGFFFTSARLRIHREAICLPAAYDLELCHHSLCASSLSPVWLSHLLAGEQTSAPHVHSSVYDLHGVLRAGSALPSTCHIFCFGITFASTVCPALPEWMTNRRPVGSFLRRLYVQPCPNRALGVGRPPPLVLAPLLCCLSYWGLGG